MKPETGKINSPTHAAQVSIQLKLSGHSFSWETLPAHIAAASGSVECVVLTAKTLLIPGEEFDQTLASDYLRLAGMTCTADEVAVHTDTQARIVAVMALDRTCHRTLREHFGRRLQFATPLLYPQKYTIPTVWFYRVESLLYIKVFDPLLQFAEAIETPDEADVLYCIEQLARIFPLKDYAAVAEGDGRKNILKYLRRYFRDFTCE